MPKKPVSPQPKKNIKTTSPKVRKPEKPAKGPNTNI